MTNTLFNINYFKKTIYELNKISSNNKSALLTLGIIYFQGLFVEKDDVKAFNCFSEIVNSGYGDAFSYLLLGNCYLMGIGTNIDYKKAFENYRHIAKKSKTDSDPNDIYAIYNYALCFEHGYGVKKNKNKAIELYQYLYKNEIVKDFDLLSYKLGDIYFNKAKSRQDYSRAYIYLVESAQEGCIKANVKLGTIFDYGHGLKSDLNRAYKYYNQAITLSNDNTPFMAYLNESSVSWGKYLNKTKGQYEVALKKDKNDLLIKYILCSLYYKSNEYDSLLKLLKDLTEKDFPQAQYQLANLIETGIYEESEDLNMYELYKKASEKKHEKALLKTIELLKHDHSELDLLLKQAIELKIEEGIYRLSIFYYLGLNTSVDYIKSFLGFSSIKEYKIDYVKLQLSLCNFLGHGMSKNYEKAFNYAYSVSSKFLYAKVLCIYLQEECKVKTDYYSDISDELLSDENDNIIVNYMRAMIYDKKSDFKNAEKCWLICLNDYGYGNINNKFKNPYDEMIENNFNEAVRNELNIPENITQIAMFNLGCYYYFGTMSELKINNIRPNLKKAEFYLTQVTGISDAQYILGLRYHREDIDKAIKCYELSLGNNKILEYILEYISLKKNFNREYTKILEKLSIDNNSIALFLKGFEMEINARPKKAIELYEKCVKAWLDKKNDNVTAYRISVDTLTDKAESTFKLANCFECGIGVNINKKEALYYYNISADHGYVAAKLTIAKSLSDLNASNSLEKAYNIYNELAASGVPEAIYMMGYFYENGLNAEVDLDYAKRCYIYAASKGYKAAIKRLDEIQK